MNFCRAALAALLVAGATACSDVPTTNAPAQDDAISPPAFDLVGRGGSATALRSRQFPDMCIDVAYSIYAPGRLLETWSCNQLANQKFIWKTTGQIVPLNSQTLCLDAGQGPSGNGIGLWNCNGHAYQAWSASAAGEIKGVNGLCLGLSRAVRANGTKLTAQTCTGSASQKWDNAAGTTPPPTLPAGIPISPGQSIQALVNANPAGTTFLMKTGRHVRQSVVPKTGNTFRCEPGAILDGENATAYAFQIGPAAPYPDNVRVVGCRITRYTPPFQYAAIRGSGDTEASSGTGWVIDSNEVDHNSQVGIRIGNRMKVRFNNVHDNGTFGISGPGDDVLVEQNQITANGDPAHVRESGGTKFVRTHGLIVRGNTVRRNHGPGLWADIANDGFLFENNTVEDQYNEGIAIEISYGGIIRNNTIRRNGLDDPRATGWPWGAGITIAASGGSGIEIYGNLLEGNAHGIALIQQARGTNHPDPAGVDPEMYVQNVNAHHNTITLQTVSGHRHPGSLGASLGVDDTGRANNLYSGRNIRFDYNTYRLNGVAYPFAWSNGYRTRAQWRGYGQDVHSTFLP